MNDPRPEREAIHRAVTATYGAVAQTRNLAEPAAACCGPSTVPLADYAPEEIASVPPGAYLGEGSGAPVRYAELQPGEIVLDLGAGAGMDSFLAAQRVGRAGHVYGFDLTPQMVERARRNAADGRYPNISFEQADIEHLPLPDATVDAAISNCVINLAPDKSAVFREIFRVLRPGGRLSISDIVLRGSPEGIQRLRASAGNDAWCACVSGALAEDDYLAAIRAAGFQGVRVVAERPGQIQPGGDVQAAAVTIAARRPA